MHIRFRLRTRLEQENNKNGVDRWGLWVGGDVHRNHLRVNTKQTFFPFSSHIETFHKHPMEIDLTQACVGELNTTVRGGDTNWPIVYGVGVNTRSGEIFPATFPDKGPDIQLR